MPSVPPSAIMPQHVLQKQKKNLTDGLHKIANTFGPQHQPQHQPHQNQQQQQHSTPRHSAHEDARPQSMVSPVPDFNHSKPTTLSQLPPGLSHEDYNRAVELVASASAFHHTANQNPEQQQHLRRQGSTISNAGHGRDMFSRTAVEMPKETEEQGGHGGHDAPNWSRTKSYSVLFGCTLLYALISGGCCSRCASAAISLCVVCRNSCRRSRRRSGRLRYSGEVSWCHPIRPCTEHDRIHECDLIRAQW